MLHTQALDSPLTHELIIILHLGERTVRSKLSAINVAPGQPHTTFNTNDTSNKHTTVSRIHARAQVYCQPKWQPIVQHQPPDRCERNSLNISIRLLCAVAAFRCVRIDRQTRKDSKQSKQMRGRNGESNVDILPSLARATVATVKY